MEGVTEVASGITLALAIGLMGVLINRRRKHLRRVVRVLDTKDMHLADFLNGLVQSGQLQPATYPAT
jgi:hypothetical protein